MNIKQIIDEDFVNYKKASMFIAFPTCTFKCGLDECQNSALTNSPNINIRATDIADRYINNPITSAIVCGGLEPFDSFVELMDLIKEIRFRTNDDIVIYTGYTEQECYERPIIRYLKMYANIVVKFGRYVAGQNKHYDEVLGINLASDNQYARRIT